MHCSCVNSNSSQERLWTPGVNSLELRMFENKSSGSSDQTSDFEGEKVELNFFNDDGSYKTVVVERNLCSSDLCQLLALKNHVAKDVNWSIVENWVELGLERTLEDHDDVLAVHHLAEQLGRHSEKKFIFRKDFRKYEFYKDPQQFFPSDMVDVGNDDASNSSAASSYLYTMALKDALEKSGDCPPVFGYLWFRENNKQVWRKSFFLLKDRVLYYSNKVELVAKVVRAFKGKNDISKDWGSDTDLQQLKVFARISDYNVYSTLNAKNQFRAPTEFGFCLRPSRPDSGTAGDVTASSSCCPETRDLQCLACDSEKARVCWLTAMRLAKYGKQLKENYKTFKAKQMESVSSSPRDYNSYQVPNESVRSRVAMDFTGNVGRIVEDPKEAKAIALAEGYQWKRRWRPHFRSGGVVGVAGQGLDAGVHVVQPWFHSGMSREQATRLLVRHGTVDGVFLVRDSHSSPGAFVLSFVCHGKILHTQIVPVMDQMRDTVCFSLDCGKTKFYDLLQLVEFYQLNTGCLPTRLTYYVMQTIGPFQNEDKVVAASF